MGEVVRLVVDDPDPAEVERRERAFERAAELSVNLSEAALEAKAQADAAQAHLLALFGGEYERMCRWWDSVEAAKGRRGRDKPPSR
jgi:hypothetical protein